MSLITTRSRYGLRLLVELAERGTNGPVDLGSVAKSQHIPEMYLSKLVRPLKAAGILRSERGSRGGYELARRADEITILSVVEALEGQSSLLACTADQNTCVRSGYCRTLPVWSGLDLVIKHYLGSITLANAAHTALDYSI